MRSYEAGTSSDQDAARGVVPRRLLGLAHCTSQATDVLNGHDGGYQARVGGLRIIRPVKCSLVACDALAAVSRRALNSKSTMTHVSRHQALASRLASYVSNASWHCPLWRRAPA